MKYTERHGRLYKRVYAVEQSTFGRSEERSPRASRGDLEVFQLPKGARILEDLRPVLVTQEFRL